MDDNVKNVDERRRFIERRACSKKVLIVLDDINENERLENLVYAPSSLRLGSRVLITTRDKGILTTHKFMSYEVNQLDHDQALKAFQYACFQR